nr:MAG TPA: hypothetical protein [Caudoviricetes sp.]
MRLLYIQISLKAINLILLVILQGNGCKVLIGSWLSLFRYV